MTNYDQTYKKGSLILDLHSLLTVYQTTNF